MSIPVPGGSGTNPSGQPLSRVLAERKYVSLYSIEDLGLEVSISGVLADADGPVTGTLQSVGPIPGTVFSKVADAPSTGVYEVRLDSGDTSTPGLYTLHWTYEVAGVPQSFVGYVEIGEASPGYDSLDLGFKGIVESAYIRFADLFDSPEGGPHLQVYFQSRFGRERMAQLLNVAIGRLNTIAQPRMTYSTDPQGKTFPYAKWGGLLDQALYVECIKHLVRSYVEQPDTMGTVVARLDRRDYMNRWQSVLDMEQRDLKDQLEHFKIAHMGLGRVHALVGGGVYGSYGPTRLPGSPAQPRHWTRFY